MNKAIFYIGLIFSIACNEKPANYKKNIRKNPNLTILDTSKFAILSFSDYRNFAFDSTYGKAELEESDISEIDTLLFKSIFEYNSKLKANALTYYSIDTMKLHYKMQIIPAINRKGEKEVWINGFCTNWGDPRTEIGWKKRVMFANDGGNCYFQFKINLVTREYYDFRVNGYG